MNKVVPINRGMYLSGYCDAQNIERIPDDILFGAGVISTVVLPQIIMSIYGGIITLVALTMVALVGSITGLVVYRHLPYQIPHCVNAETAAQSPPREDNTVKKAA